MKVYVACTLLLLIKQSSTKYMATKGVTFNTEIENLEHLCNNGLVETLLLVDSVVPSINDAIDSEYNDITQYKLESTQLIGNITAKPFQCSSLHSIALSTIIPNAIFTCEQSRGLKVAVEKWDIIKNDILECAESVNTACVQSIEENISKTKADNKRDIPDLARAAYTCVRSNSDAAALSIRKTNEEFFTCLG
ncbi:hypothetical protein FQR65_LT18869 [Abscondita terminalis]|nr:hypothetical protein FQR65_LT18869 [Abscondita terminalis]